MFEWPTYILEPAAHQLKEIARENDIKILRHKKHSI